MTEPVGNQFRRGDIWMIDFGDAPSDPEQGFHRPALIVSDDRLHHPNLRMLVVVPGTSAIRGLSLHVIAEPGEVSGLETPTAFQVEQVRAVSTHRAVRQLGTASSAIRYSIDDVLRLVLKL